MPILVTLDNLSRPSQFGSKTVAGIDLSKSRSRAVLNAVIALAASPNGMTVSDLAAKVRELLGLSPEDYKPRQATHDLKKLRGKQWVAPSENPAAIRQLLMASAPLRPC